MARIIEAFVRNLKPESTRKSFSDNGLVLDVNPSGKKVFFHKYRQDRKQVKVKIGEYPTISVAEARKLILQQKHDIQIKDIKLQTVEMTFKTFVEGEFKDWLFANNKSARDSYQTIQAHFVPFLGDYKLKKITAGLIEKWKSKRLNADISAATVTRNLTELRTVLHRVEDWYGLKSIMPLVKNPKITKEREKLYLSKDELERLRTVCNEYRFGALFPQELQESQRDEEAEIWNMSHFPEHMPYIIETAINTGMRQGEILQLQWGDINFTEKLITVRGSTEKTATAREIPISEKLLNDLKIWVGRYYDLDTDEEMDAKDLVFPFTEIKRAWRTLRKRAKIEHIEFHTLRHHFGSTLALKNVPITVIMSLMGHRNIKTTQRYLSVRREDKFKAVNLL